MNNIFTDMQSKIGCPYFFDLLYYKRAVWFEMKRLCLSDYPKKTLEDFTCYVFGVPYINATINMYKNDHIKMYKINST